MSVAERDPLVPVGIRETHLPCPRPAHRSELPAGQRKEEAGLVSTGPTVETSTRGSPVDFLGHSEPRATLIPLKQDSFALGYGV